MATLHHALALVASHWFDIFLAFLWAVIVDLLSFRSRIFAIVHYIKNRRSERSAAKLQERITQLEKQRDSYTSYLHSDKALYLANFHTLFGVLLVVAIAASLNVLSEMQPAFGIRPAFPLGVFSLLFYFLAIVLAAQGITTASLNTRGKISESITKLELEIADLKKKLQAITLEAIARF
jgi:hypothetical protein